MEFRNNRHRSQPKALIGRIIPNDLIERTKCVLYLVNPMPVALFTKFYEYKYGEEFGAFDAFSLGFNNGLIGFFEELCDIISLTSTEMGYMVTLKERSQTLRNASNIISLTGQRLNENQVINKFLTFVQYRHSRRKHADLFDPSENHVLWANFNDLLRIPEEEIQIIKSPFEKACSGKLKAVEVESRLIRQRLSQFPDGIPLNDLCMIVEGRAKKLFNMRSIEQFVTECFELFYIKESTNENEEPLIFDGTLKTYDDLTGASLELKINVNRIVLQAIMSGLYQKSLLLIRKAGRDGLKLGVWYSSFRANFHSEPKKSYEKLLCDSLPLTIFLALAHRGLVEIRSHQDSKNDLRIFLPPTKIDFDDLILELGSIYKLESSSNSSTDRSTSL